MQKTGESTRDRWHKTDWDTVKQNPKSIEFPREDWIHGFDAEKYAEDNYDEAIKKLAIKQEPEEENAPLAAVPPAVVV